MSTAIAKISRKAGAFFTEKSITKQQLNRVMLVLFILMMIPLVLISLYNYPADDDFQSSLPAATAWAQTGSLVEVAKAVWSEVSRSYMEWHGIFVSGILCCTSLMIFDINLYFINNWMALATLCLSIGYLVKTLLYHLLNTEKGSFWIVYTPIMVLVLQFMPSIGDGIYWHTGSTYLFVFCNMMMATGLLLRANQPQSKARAAWRGCMLALNGFMIGGSFYGPMLGAALFLVFVVAICWFRKLPNRIFGLVTLLFLALSLVVNVTAPGIALRQERMGDPESPAVSVITAILDGFDLAGGWLSPQLLAALLLLIPILWKPLKESRLSFSHPFLFWVMLFGFFSATLVPGIYTKFSYTMGRYYNVIYLNFLVMSLGSMLYAEGWLIRYLQRRQEEEVPRQALALTQNLGSRFTALYLALSIALLALGGFAFTIMNTSSVSALKSLATGEAKEFRHNMAERQEYIRVTDSDEVAVTPLDRQPYVFKPDKLAFQGIYGRVRYMKWYFELFYNAEHPQETQPTP